MIYEIFEGNMERLEKKLLTIANKCKAYGCDFHYEIVGETFKELIDEHNIKYTARFIQVEAEGTAVINDWEFIASVEHTENGNIFSGQQGVEIPERYYNVKSVCEHCNTTRYRKYTYIIRNKNTGEFKQVGKSCLKDFTHGMSAEMITQYVSLFDTLIKGDTPEPGCKVGCYLKKEEYLMYAAETIRCFGYVKADSEDQSTAARALDYYNADNGRIIDSHYARQLQEEMAHAGFDINRADTRQLVKDALDWIAHKKEDNNYIHNLKTVCSLEYVTYKNFALLASLCQAYTREQERLAKWLEEHPTDETRSVFIGNVNDKICFKARTARCMTSFETQYGTKRIYKFIDENGNVYIWKTGKVVNETKDVEITGIVKGHAEFRGIKQTELTRCYVVKG